MSDVHLAEPPQEDLRRGRILAGATAAFLAYGFQRTTMEDIARAAEISRPALYLQFRNKTDIYRALAADFLQRILALAEAAMSDDAPLASRLEKALMGTLDTVLEIERTPHGAEILDMKASLAGDIMAEGRRRLQEIFRAALAQETGRIGRPAELASTVASMILDAVDGLRLRNPPLDEQREAIVAYIRIALGALER